MSIWHWLLVLAVIVLLFGGSKRFRNLGSDVGAMMRGFKDGLQGENGNAQPTQTAQGANSERTTIEGQAARKE